MAPINMPRTQLSIFIMAFLIVICGQLSKTEAASVPSMSSKQTNLAKSAPNDESHGDREHIAKPGKLEKVGGVWEAFHRGVQHDEDDEEEHHNYEEEEENEHRRDNERREEEEESERDRSHPEFHVAEFLPGFRHLAEPARKVGSSGSSALDERHVTSAKNENVEASGSALRDPAAMTGTMHSIFGKRHHHRRENKKQRKQGPH